ncbi:SMP-30/gluconolactonase/LRE family protein [Pseudomonas frederiksbergensis]|uniref:SMP-30/gluconolactonase/LRE family protein n=1 Tax=Pseudomonas frederiksbergensis TaxID=104087 RepID=UPI003D046A20
MKDLCISTSRNISSRDWQSLFVAAFLSLLLPVSNSAHATDAALSAAPRDCVTANDVIPICGLVGPEDVELLKDGQTLVVSELPAEFEHPHGPGLMLADLTNNTSRPLPIRIERETGWGVASCLAPPAIGLSTHGIHLSTRTDGRTQLLVVNHSAGDSIQAFELVGDKGNYQAVWRGCAVFNGGAFNDVAALPGGGFVATVMLDKDLIKDQNPLDVMLSGKNTGYLVEWHPETGFRRLPESEAALSNGVQVSQDGRYIYFTAWTSRQVERYDRSQHKVTGTAETAFYPDNISVQPDGSMLVTGIDDMAAFRNCTKAQGGFCSRLLAFTVARFDAETMKITPYYHAAVGTLAGGSVALQVGGRLYMGTYTGDRLVSVKAP